MVRREPVPVQLASRPASIAYRRKSRGPPEVDAVPGGDLGPVQSTPLIHQRCTKDTAVNHGIWPQVGQEQCIENPIIRPADHSPQTSRPRPRRARRQPPCRFCPAIPAIVVCLCEEQGGASAGPAAGLGEGMASGPSPSFCALRGEVVLVRRYVS